MRQHDGVGLGMRQVEGAAERVAELVMQRHADGAEADAAQPGAIERFAASLAIVALGGDGGQGACERADAFLRHQRDDRIGVARIERFHRMRDRVDAGGRGQARRQRQGEIDIIDHGLRQDGVRRAPWSSGRSRSGRRSASSPSRHRWWECRAG